MLVSLYNHKDCYMTTKEIICNIHRLPRMILNRPGFLRGVAYNHDMYNIRPRGVYFSFDEDTKNMKDDFQFVGHDIRCSMNRLSNKLVGHGE